MVGGICDSFLLPGLSGRQVYGGRPMSTQPVHRSLESLKKEAKRWLAALRRGHPDSPARARLERAIPDAPIQPTLRIVQHALAREHGFSGWSALKEAIADSIAAGRERGRNALARYEAAASALLDAYRSGTPEAMAEHYSHTWHRRAWPAMRTYVQLDLGKRPAHDRDEVEITIEDARYLVAIEHGFDSWDQLEAFTRSPALRDRVAARPVRLTQRDAPEDSHPILESRSWSAVLDILETNPSACLKAEGQMTDDVLADVARLESVTALDLSGSQAVTDDGLLQLARLPRLEHLDASGTSITDRGLEVVQHLPNLKALSLAMTRMTDAGAAHLAYCWEIESLNLSWTHTGDGAIRALAGHDGLREFSSGNLVSDAGLPMLHELPVFKRWRGGEPRMALLSHRSAPNHLSLRGVFTDRGMQHLRGLDGLFGLNLDDAKLGLTAAALEPLVTLPNLGWLAVDAKDDWMPYIARMPRLRFLSAQDTSAGDDGFASLSKSRSIEYIWGRRCHNLRRRGFAALATMPLLRGLSVSCLNVDDAGIAVLPDFPMLRELMPMDVPDAGYRHIGQCKGLESLILMYCRDTTDAATEQITGLSRLGYYFNSYTTITDRTPELLSNMPSLERITFDACHNLTNDGVARLTRLPRLRELRVSGRQITSDVARAFEPGVIVYPGH
jgi:Leucine-rich repeat (LRR) protein